MKDVARQVLLTLLLRRGPDVDFSLVKYLLSPELISHKLFLKSFCKSQFPHKFVNLFFILDIVMDKLTDLWRSKLL